MSEIPTCRRPLRIPSPPAPLELEDERDSDVEYDPDADEYMNATGRRAERLQTIANVVRGYGGAR